MPGWWGTRWSGVNGWGARRVWEAGAVQRARWAAAGTGGGQGTWSTVRYSEYDVLRQVRRQRRAPARRFC